METILLKILEVQNEILAELRQLRQAIVHGAELNAASQPLPTAASQPAQSDPVSQASRIDPAAPMWSPPPTPSPAAVAAPPTHQPGARLTAHELADIGGQFLDASHMPRGKVKQVDVSDLSGSILDDIKAKNKAKRSAFAEFEKFDKFGRDR
ncbi:MAG: hypothetical protein ACLGQH_08320 [Acidobacteriota bacterium]